MNKPISKDELLSKCGLHKSGSKFECEDATVIIEDDKVQIITYDFENHGPEPVGLITIPVPLNLIGFQPKKQ